MTRCLSTRVRLEVLLLWYCCLSSALLLGGCVGGECFASVGKPHGATHHPSCGARSSSFSAPVEGTRGWIISSTCLVPLGGGLPLSLLSSTTTTKLFGLRVPNFLLRVLLVLAFWLGWDFGCPPFFFYLSCFYPFSLLRSFVFVLAVGHVSTSVLCGTGACDFGLFV